MTMDGWSGSVAWVTWMRTGSSLLSPRAASRTQPVNWPGGASAGIKTSTQNAWVTWPSTRLSGSGIWNACPSRTGTRASGQ